MHITHSCTHTCTKAQYLAYTHAHTHAHKHNNSHAHTLTHSHTHTHIHTHVHTYTHTCTHTHIHTQGCGQWRWQRRRQRVLRSVCRGACIFVTVCLPRPKCLRSVCRGVRFCDGVPSSSEMSAQCVQRCTFLCRCALLFRNVCVVRAEVFISLSVCLPHQKCRRSVCRGVFFCDSVPSSSKMCAQCVQKCLFLCRYAFLVRNVGAVCAEFFFFVTVCLPRQKCRRSACRSVYFFVGVPSSSEMSAQCVQRCVFL